MLVPETPTAAIKMVMRLAYLLNQKGLFSGEDIASVMNAATQEHPFDLGAPPAAGADPAAKE